MGEKMKLKVEALRMLQSELHPNEMVAIYIMEFGTEVPPKLIKHLTKIVKLLCRKLDWIDDGCHPPGPVAKSIFYLLTYLCKKMIDFPGGQNFKFGPLKGFLSG